MPSEPPAWKTWSRASRRQCADDARDKYGIVLVDVKIKRIGLPEQVRDSVFERMRKERARIAQRYRSEGNEEAMKIRAAADKEKTVILAEAYAEAEIVRGKAEADGHADLQRAPIRKTPSSSNCCGPWRPTRRSSTRRRRFSCRAIRNS